jgi:hypothetical protein
MLKSNQMLALKKKIKKIKKNFIFFLYFLLSINYDFLYINIAKNKKFNLKKKK